MASSAIDIEKSQISKMSEMDLVNSGSGELITGFSTPPSSSLDNCDSGFNDLYSNNFSLLSTGNMKGSQTTPVQTDPSFSSLESAQLFDDNSVAANDSENQMTNSADDEQVGPSMDTFKNSKSNGGLMASKSNKSIDYIARNDEIDVYNDDSNMSDISDLSDVFKLNADILPDMQRSIDWIHMQIASGVNPRDCLSRIFVNSPKQTIPENVSDNDLWRVIAAILSDPPRRQRLQHVQTIEQVCETIKKSQNIIVLTGAGVSVSCGIPDFRSRDGIYERLRVEYPDMRDPQSMFDIGYFARDPRPFYQFAREIYPGLFEPSLSHRFIKLLERKGKLLRNYTQNIDTLERVAGIENVIECHGSFATASCTRCKHKVEANDIQEDILHQRIPMCKLCELANSTVTASQTIATDTETETEAETIDQNTTVLSSRPERPFNYNQLVAAGVMKPDIVFFGESLPDKFHSMIELDKTKCDLLIVIGSSLKVRPVALIPSSINLSIPQILINREQLDHFVFDVELLGDSDVIINTLCHMLGEDWNDICSQPELKQTNELQMHDQLHSNIHNIPPLLANAVIKKTQESSIQCASDGNQTIANVNDATNSVSNDSIGHHQQQSIESTSPSSSSSSSSSSSLLSSSSSTNDKSTSNDIPFSTMANYLPDRTFFFNEKYSYIFPGAEIWWKDSDLESNSTDSSSDSSVSDDDLLKDNGNENGDDIDDMEIEMATIERNEMIDDVEQTIAVENLIETTTEHEFNKYLLKRSADTSLEEEEIIVSEKITTATTTTELTINCSKRLRAQTEFELEVAPTSSCDSNSNSSSTNTSSTSIQSDLYEI